MNKQVIIAGALGAAAAWTCDQPFVTRADEITAAADQLVIDTLQAKEDAVAARDTADGKGAAALQVQTDARQAVIDHDAALDQYKDAVTAADSLKGVEAGKKGDALAAKGKQDLIVTAQGTDGGAGKVKTAIDLVVAQQGLIDAQVTLVENLDAAVTELTAEIAVRTAASVAADVTYEAAKASAVTAAAALAYAKASRDTNWQGWNIKGIKEIACQERRVLVTADKPLAGYELQWWNATASVECLEADRPKSLTALKVAEEARLGVPWAAEVPTVSVEVPATGLYATLNGADNVTGLVKDWTDASATMATAYEAYDLAVRKWAIYVAGCRDGTAGSDIAKCSGSGSTAADTDIYDLRVKWTALVPAASLLTARNVAIQALQVLSASRAEAAVNIERSKALVSFYTAEIAAVDAATTATSGVADAPNVFDDDAAATAEETKQQGLYRNALQAQKTAEDQKAQAITRQTAGNAYMDVLRTALEPLAADVAVQQFLRTQAEKESAAQEVLRAAAEQKETDALAAWEFAKQTVVDADESRAFLVAREASAEASYAVFTGAVTDTEGAWNAAVLAAAKAKTQSDAALAACEGQGYSVAQAARKQKTDDDAQAAEDAAAIVTSYAATAAAPTSGAGVLCAFPAPDADGTQQPRAGNLDGVNCGGDDTLCCGAAQKFLKDGTKLSIETCQVKATTHTYQYYPPLPLGATVEPEPETWRWQCISGAQKLVAAATATLAASYMMA